MHTLSVYGCSLLAMTLEVLDGRKLRAETRSIPELLTQHADELFRRGNPAAPAPLKSRDVQLIPRQRHGGPQRTATG